MFAGSPVPLRAELLLIQARGEPVVRGDKQPGASDRFALGQREGHSEESLLRGGVLGRVAFGQPNPLAALEAHGRFARERGPLRVRREALPRVLLQQLLAEGRLPRAGQVHGFVPGDLAVGGREFCANAFEIGTEPSPRLRELCL